MIGENMVYRTFTQTYDLNTEQGAPTLLGVHSPIGGDSWRFLRPFFEAYRKFKYCGCDITIVNAARLPVDPEQLGKIEGTNYVDPRDTLNPIMFKGCHGESLGAVLNSMYGGLTSDLFKGSSIDKETLTSTLENFYYTALGDDAWRKSPIQKTLRIRGLHPLVYSLGTQHQILPSNGMDAQDYAENSAGYSSDVVGNVTEQPGFFRSNITQYGRAPAVPPTNIYDPANNEFVARMLGSLFTTKMTRLGWMDTLQLVGNKSGDLDIKNMQITELPKAFMGLLMLPPSYLCRQYLRVIITHKYKFSGYRTITTGNNDFDPRLYSVGYYNEFTGNVPANSSKSVADLTDYDAIEESDNDGVDS